MELNYTLEKAEALADKYASIVITQMKANLLQNDLVDTMKLINSVKSKIKIKNFQVDSIQFSYEFYGLIWEKGASNVFGKGITLNPRSWRDKAIESIKNELESDFGELYAQKIIEELVLEDIQISI